MTDPAFAAWQSQLLGELRVARLATISDNGRPHLVPVCYALLEGRIVIAIDEKPKASTNLARLRNIARDPRVTLLFDRYSDDWSQLAWVRIEGNAAVLETGAANAPALAALRNRYSQYVTMSLETLPLITATPTRITGWRAN